MATHKLSLPSRQLHRNVMFIWPLAALIFVGCKESTSTKAPQPAMTSGSTTVIPPTTVTAPPITADMTAVNLVAVDAATTTPLPVGTPLTRRFELQGAAGRNIQVALLETPVGGTMTMSGTSIIYQWPSPINGTHNLRFLMRDMTACSSATGSITSTTCAMPVAGTATSASTTVAQSYDKVSQTFTLPVGSGTAGDTSGMGPLVNGIVSSIMGMLGSSGMPPGALGPIQSVLSTLSSGQLTQIMGQMQGGNTNISSILQQFGGFTLTELEQAGLPAPEKVP